MYSVRIVAMGLIWAASHCATADTDRATVTLKVLGRCDASRPPAKPEVRSVTREEGTLVVSVTARGTCGGMRVDLPEVNVSGNAVALSWKWVHPDNAPVTGCVCPFHLQFRVKGAPEGDISVTAQERE